MQGQSARQRVAEVSVEATCPTWQTRKRQMGGLVIADPCEQPGGVLLAAEFKPGMQGETDHLLA